MNLINNIRISEKPNLLPPNGKGAIFPKIIPTLHFIWDIIVLKYQMDWFTRSRPLSTDRKRQRWRWQHYTIYGSCKNPHKEWLSGHL
jgi:hypothetical protein